MKAEEIVNFLRAKYPTHQNGYNQHVVLEQVADGTGWAQSRWIDVVVFHMWQSKKLTRAAFEVKVSRTDFLHELDNPDKHQWCKECFHEFWFVAPKDVIQIEELPIGVGWMYPRGSQLCIARRAIRNENPKIDDNLLAAFMRAASKEVERTEKQAISDGLLNDTRYKEAQMYLQGINRFLKERGNYRFLENADAVFNALEEATMDKQLKQDREQFLSVTGKFQRDMIYLLNGFITITQKSLFARDEMGRYLVNGYGGVDDEGIEKLKEILNDPKASILIKKYAGLVNVLASWERL